MPTCTWNGGDWGGKRQLTCIAAEPHSLSSSSAAYLVAFGKEHCWHAGLDSATGLKVMVENSRVLVRLPGRYRLVRSCFHSSW